MLSQITTTPSICPVNIEILRQHAVLDRTDDDDLLMFYGTSATELAEQFTGRIFLRKQITWTIANDDPASVYPFGVFLMQRFRQRWIHLPHTATAVTDARFGGWGNADTVLVEGADYQVDLATSPTRLRMVSASAYAYNSNHLSVTYTSGYGTTEDSIPAPIRHAIMVLTTRFREFKGDDPANIWCAAAENLLAPYKIFRFGGPAEMWSA
jgi:uncharacterized phiE125 gp8 family phage protein